MKIFKYFIVPILANFEDYKACLDFYGEELRKCGENVSEYPICLEEDPNYRPLGPGGRFIKDNLPSKNKKPKFET